MAKNVKLIHGECLAEMAKLRDKSVDMVLCDLPYGTTQNKWDTVIDLDRMWAQYDHICAGPIVLTAAQPFTSALIMSNVHNFKYTWTWDKVNRITGFLNAKKQPLRVTEDIAVFYQGQPTYNPQMVQGEPYKTTHGEGSKNYGSQVKTEYVCNGDRYPQSIIRIAGDERGKVGRIHPHPEARRAYGVPHQDIHPPRNDGAR